MTISGARLGDALRRTRLALSVAVVALIPLVGLPREDQRATLPLELSYFYIADVALIAVALLSIPSLVASMRHTRSIEGAFWIALFALLFIAFVLNPSRSGTDLLIRLIAAVALYRTIADADADWRRYLAAALAVAAIPQAIVSSLQVVTGAPLGLGPLGELSADLLSYGSLRMAQGTLGHAFILGALALLSGIVLSGEALRSRRPGPWLVAAALAIGSAGTVYARTVAFSFTFAWGAFVAPAFRDRRYRYVLLALVIGFGSTVLAFNAGWVSSLSRGLASERVEMMQQAAAIVEDQPFFGVGPGNYVSELHSRQERHLLPVVLNVHNVPALLAAEAGLLAGIVSAALLLLVGVRSLRAGWLGTALFASFFLWTVLDVLPYVTPQGVVLSAVWLGAIRHAERWPP